MKCPACLLYNNEVEAETTVNGTDFCKQHGQEALLRSSSTVVDRSRPGAPTVFGPPWSAPGAPVTDTPTPVTGTS
mgnify:CR=1 FL=1